MWQFMLRIVLFYLGFLFDAEATLEDNLRLQYLDTICLKENFSFKIKQMILKEEKSLQDPSSSSDTRKLNAFGQIVKEMINYRTMKERKDLLCKIDPYKLRTNSSYLDTVLHEKRSPDSAAGRDNVPNTDVKKEKGMSPRIDNTTQKRSLDSARRDNLPNTDVKKEKGMSVKIGNTTQKRSLDSAGRDNLPNTDVEDKKMYLRIDNIPRDEKSISMLKRSLGIFGKYTIYSAKLTYWIVHYTDDKEALEAMAGLDGNVLEMRDEKTKIKVTKWTLGG